MTVIASPIPKNKFKKSEIPAYLIYEVLNGKPIYYKGYKTVLSKEKNLNDIMAIGYLQAIILNILHEYLIIQFKKQGLKTFTGEVGIHVKKGTNLSCDLVVFEQKRLENIDITAAYFKIPPKIVLEIDTNGDFEETDFYTYSVNKTRILLNFGVEKVIWILSQHKMVIVATSNKAWAMTTWDATIEIVEGHPIKLADLFEENGLASINTSTSTK